MSTFADLAAAGFSPERLSNVWTIVFGTEEAAGLEDELRREMVRGHLLDGKAVVAVAIHARRKECIFWVPSEARWAWVHLTWSVESNPAWPRTEVFEGWDDLIVELADGERL